MDLNAGIKISVLGVQGVEKLINKSKTLNGIIDKINAAPITLNVRKDDSIAAAIKQLNDFSREVVNGEKHLANNEAALQQQSAALRQYAANLKTGSAERKNALQAQVKAEQKLTFAQYDQIEAQSKMLMLGKQQNNESFKGIRQLIDYGAKVKNNTKSLDLYAQQLRETISFVEIGSREYRELALAINSVNKQLERGQKLAKAPVATTQYGKPIGPQPLSLRRQTRTPLGGQAPQGRLGPALIGAAFPALFGGGPGAILGGFAGELAGPLGGVVGSALGMQFDALAETMSNLGKALDPLNPDFETLVERLGAVGTPLAQVIASYQELGREEEALALATKELAGLVGADGVKALESFSDSTVTVQNSFNQLLTQMLAGLAAAFGELPNIIGKDIERAVLLGRAERSDDPAMQDLVRRREEARAGSLSGKTSGFMGALMGGDPKEFKRLTEEIIGIQKNAAIERQQRLMDAAQLLQDEIDKKKEQNELDKQEKVLLDQKIERHKIAQGAIQAQTVALEGQIQIFNLQAQAAQSVFAVTQARNKSELSALKLEESRLQRQLANLQRIDGFYNKQRDIINKIANNRKKQAELEFKVTQQSIKQMVAKAELERQAVRFQVQKINLQIELLRLQAEEIEDTQKKLESLARINQQAMISAEIAKQMTISADKSLASAKEIAKFQELSAQHLLDGKLESIEAERVDARRAVHAAAIARSAKAAANATSSGSGLSESVSNSVKNATTLGPAGRSTQTMSTSADADVFKKVVESAPFGGYKNPVDLQNALNKAQANKDLRAKQMARRQETSRRLPRSPLAMIGEKGPEYVIPEKKAGAFATNYLMGARGAGAIPRYAEGGYTGSINIQTGPVMQQDNQTYLTIGQFEEGMRELTESLARGGRSYGSRQFQGIS